MGMRRLSIIDLALGKQPIFSEDRTKVIVFNGEIYNHIELRRELVGRGHVFSTNSDTEVIVHLYEDKAERCLEDLNGMFAFALWDARKQSLFLARDRLGIKSLYTAVTANSLLFSSELNGLLECPDVDRTVDVQAIDDFFTYFYIPGSQSVYRSIRKLPPAQYQVWRNGKHISGRYWRLPNEQISGRRQRIESYAEEFWERLKRSIALQLRSDVPVGVFLSGGLDSGAVVAAAAAVSGQRIDTFTVGFESPSYDERVFARATAERYGTRHHELLIGPGELLRTAELLRHFGEPFGPFTIAQSHALSSFSRDHAKVALAGDGGDELFGGYQTYVASSLAPWYLKLPKGVREYLVQPAARWLPVSDRLMSLEFKVREFLRGAEGFSQAGNMAWKVIFGPAERKRLFSKEFVASLGARSEFSYIQNLIADGASGSSLHRASYLDLAMFLPDSVLTQTDRMSMAASQEVRVPILDHDMIEFAATVPHQYKCRWGRTKILVRKALEQRLPREVLHKGKTGFTTPIADWLRHELREFVCDALTEHRLKETGIINAAYVNELLKEHFSKTANHSRRIWSVVSFMLWWNLATPTSV
jgi:asparagine synthase (glutamine-hydrolysing)